MPEETKAPEIVTAESITPTEMPTPTNPAPAASAEKGAAGSPPPAPAVGVMDSAGVAYDAQKHIPKTNRLTGRWMPRGGRKPGHAAPPAAPSPSFIPSAVPPAPPTESAAPKITAEPAEPVAPAFALDHSSDAGEVVSRGVQLAAGVVFKSPEDCEATPSEHKHMVNATAAYIRHKGWQAAAGVGLLLMFAAWFMKIMQKPKPAGVVRGWLGLDASQPRNVTPTAEQPKPSAESFATPANIPPLAPR